MVFLLSFSLISLASDDINVMNSTQHSMRRSRASLPKTSPDDGGRISVTIFCTVAMIQRWIRETSNKIWTGDSEWPSGKIRYLLVRTSRHFLSWQEVLARQTDNDEHRYEWNTPRQNVEDDRRWCCQLDDSRLCSNEGRKYLLMVYLVRIQVAQSLAPAFKKWRAWGQRGCSLARTAFLHRRHSPPSTFKGCPLSHWYISTTRGTRDIRNWTRKAKAKKICSNKCIDDTGVPSTLEELSQATKQNKSAAKFAPSKGWILKTATATQTRNTQKASTLTTKFPIRHSGLPNCSKRTC